ncbi:MAG: KH domain-containing protein [Candidatus Aminicenantales bacterium]
MKELVELIAKSLVDNLEKVHVSQIDGEQSSIIELKVAPEDVGKVIGKQGRNVQAIRIILGAAGMKLKRRFNLEIIEKG